MQNRHITVQVFIGFQNFICTVCFQVFSTWSTTQQEQQKDILIKSLINTGKHIFLQAVLIITVQLCTAPHLST